MFELFSVECVHEFLCSDQDSSTSFMGSEKKRWEIDSLEVSERACGAAHGVQHNVLERRMRCGKADGLKKTGNPLSFCQGG